MTRCNSPTKFQSCAIDRTLAVLRTHLSRKSVGLTLGILLPAAAFAGGVDVSTDVLYSDDVTLTTFDGDELHLNSDGNPDLAVASNLSGNADASRYYPGNGDGTFGTPVLLQPGASSEILAVDLNGDGLVDLVQGRRDLTSLFYLGDGAGGFIGNGTAISADTDRVLTMAAGDLDGDGDIDLVTGTGHAGGLSANPLQPNRFYLNDGGVSPTFTSDVIPEAVEDDTRSIALADMDGDLNLDVIVGNDETTPGSNLIYLNQVSGGTVSFATGFDFGPPDDQTSKILIGDVNNDGKPDIVTLNTLETGFSDGVNRFFLNQSTVGNLQFAEANVSTDADRSNGGVLADFDGDGDLDLAVANTVPTTADPGGTARNRLYLNLFVENGDGTVSFAAGMDISPDEHQSRELTAADINGDGHLDIVVGNQFFQDSGQDFPGEDRRYLHNGDPDAPFTNVAPVIDAQARALQTAVDTDLTIVLDDDVEVTDPDNVFPVDFTLTVQAGANYTFTDNTITPDTGFEGQLTVPVVVNDGTEDSAAFELCVTVGSGPVCNNAPSFTSTPVTTAAEGEAYTYDVTASDPDAGATLTITAPTLPAWLTLTDNGGGTATLTGTPAAGDVGDHPVSLQVSDGTDTAVQDFTVTVAAAPAGNNPPEFTSTAVTAATEDEAYSYDVTASDPDTGDTLTITAPTLPAWLVLTDNGDGTATLSGTPAAGDVGNHDVSLQVSDGDATAVQDFTVAVEAAAAPPPGGGGGGGGGALGFLSLLALLTFGASGMRRRNR